MDELILIDNSNNEYMVDDPQRFYDHLVDYHTKNNVADQSIHEEQGFYFTVTEDLFKKVEDFVLNYKT